MFHWYNVEVLVTCITILFITCAIQVEKGQNKNPRSKILSTKPTLLFNVALDLLLGEKLGLTMN
jgi:hypothetical protein